MSNKSLYDVLGIPNNATEIEIKKAYRSLSLKYHPDRNPNAEANKKMNEINGAYDILGDVEQRKKYDNEKLGINLPNMAEFTDINNIFNMMFNGIPKPGIHRTHTTNIPNIHIYHSNNGGNFNFHTQINTNIKPANITKEILITLEQVYTGCEVNIDFERIIKKENEDQINENDTLVVKIPQGINNNESIIIPEKGHIKNNIKGDIKIKIIVQNTTEYTCQGLDIIKKSKISLKESLCGFVFNFTYLNGKNYSLNNTDDIIVIKPGYKKIIPNMGLTRNNITGNLILEIDVEYPDKLDEDIRKKIENIL